MARFPEAGCQGPALFWWTVQFCTGFDVLFYSHPKCFGLFVSDAYKLKFRARQFNIELLFVSVLSANLSHTLSGHISSAICQPRRTVIVLIVSSAFNTIYALLFFFFNQSCLCLTLSDDHRIYSIWMNEQSSLVLTQPPIRHLWLLITSQPLGLRCSGSHTWLHPDYILPPASLIWLFMGRAALSVGCQNMPRLIEKHGLEQKKRKNKHRKKNMTPRHRCIVLSNWTFKIYYSVKYGCFCWAASLWSVVSIPLWHILPVPVSRGGGIQAILQILKTVKEEKKKREKKKRKALKLLNIWVKEIMPGSQWPLQTWQTAARLRCCRASY